MLEKSTSLPKSIFITLRQKRTKGLGHAVWLCGVNLLEMNHCSITWVMIFSPSRNAMFTSINGQYEGHNSSVIGVQTVPEKWTHRYGIIDPVSKTIVVIKYVNLWKKPVSRNSTINKFSNYGVVYVLTQEICYVLREPTDRCCGEIQLTDAIHV